MIRLHDVWRKRRFNAVLPDNLTVAEEVKFQRVSLYRIHVGSPLLYGFVVVVEHSLTRLAVFRRQTSDRQVAVSEQHYIPGKGRSGTLLSGRSNVAGTDAVKVPGFRTGTAVADVLPPVFISGGAYV